MNAITDTDGSKSRQMYHMDHETTFHIVYASALALARLSLFTLNSLISLMNPVTSYCMLFHTEYILSSAIWKSEDYELTTISQRAELIHFTQFAELVKLLPRHVSDVDTPAVISQLIQNTKMITRD